MKSVARALFASCVLWRVAPPALAGEVRDADAERSHPAVDHSAMRLRLGVAGNVLLGVAGAPLHYPGPGGAYPSSLAGAAGGAGVAVDAGLRVGDRMAFYVRAQASGFGPRPFASEAAAYGVAEWAPLA